LISGRKKIVGTVLVVYHSKSGNTKAAAEAVAAGAKEVEGTTVFIKEGLKATTEDLLSCDVIAVGTPDYFSYMAGGLKDFFDRTFYLAKEEVSDKPCGIFVTHGGGGRAVESVKNICKSFKFRIIGQPVLVKHKPDEKGTAALKDLGRRLAESAD
jgi:flavorubredoxin